MDGLHLRGHFLWVEHTVNDILRPKAYAFACLYAYGSQWQHVTASELCLTSFLQHTRVRF